MSGCAPGRKLFFKTGNAVLLNSSHRVEQPYDKYPSFTKHFQHVLSNDFAQWEFIPVCLRINIVENFSLRVLLIVQFAFREQKRFFGWGYINITWILKTKNFALYLRDWDKCRKFWSASSHQSKITAGERIANIALIVNGWACRRGQSIIWYETKIFDFLMVRLRMT